MTQPGAPAAPAPRYSTGDWRLVGWRRWRCWRRLASGLHVPESTCQWTLQERPADSVPGRARRGHGSVTVVTNRRPTKYPSLSRRRPRAVPELGLGYLIRWDGLRQHRRRRLGLVPVSDSEPAIQVRRDSGLVVHGVSESCIAPVTSSTHSARDSDRTPARDSDRTPARDSDRTPARTKS